MVGVDGHYGPRVPLHVMADWSHETGTVTTQDLHHKGDIVTVTTEIRYHAIPKIVPVNNKTIIPF